jgi:N-methylhydantoinase A
MAKKVFSGSKRFILGLDTGGTFTDVVVLDLNTGETHNGKSPTTYRDFSEGVVNAIEVVSNYMDMSTEDLLRQTSLVRHGTTVGTNAIITGRGEKVGFITTKGFEDTTLIGRAVQRVDGLGPEELLRMPLITKPEPLVPKSCLTGVYERIDFKGNIVIPLNIEDAEAQIKALVEVEKVKAIGVSLLFSWLNPVHEREIGRIIDRMYPGHDLFITLSHELIPLVREYGRANTVILNCFIGRIMENYLKELNYKLTAKGFEGRLLVMQSNGGSLSFDRVDPIRTVASGPVGGVIGCQYLSKILGHPNVISCDMGGTSFDVSILADGESVYEREPILSRWRLMLPIVKVDSIGAGGGTIAQVHPITKRLMVGPDSAGSEPGPVCYDKGGTQPTICDADLILGFLDPENFLGGKIKLNKAKAEQSLMEKIASPLDMDVIAAAAGIFTISNAHMSDLVRVIAMSSGIPPNEFTLYAFGGTGPMHAAYIADELGIGKVYIFPNSATFSAFGILCSDIVKTSSFSLGFSMPIDAGDLDAEIKKKEQTLAQEMVNEGFDEKSITFRHVFNMRYRRQVNYHSIFLPRADYKTDADIEELVNHWVSDFQKVYGKEVGYSTSAIELVSMDIDAVGETEKPKVIQAEVEPARAAAAPSGRRPVFFPGFTDDFIETEIYEYDRLEPGSQVKGPAVIVSHLTTVVVPPEKSARVDHYHNILIEL